MPVYEAFVPTPPDLVREKLRLAQIQANETVFDLGCGDSAPLLIAAREFQARCVGIEIRPELIDQSQQSINAAGLQDRIELRCEDYMNSDFSTADVIFLYLTRGSMGPLSFKLENELPSGTRIVTHTFDLPAWTEESHTQYTDQSGQLHDLYLYRTP